jgi:hypothetical protein
LSCQDRWMHWQPSFRLRPLAAGVALLLAIGFGACGKSASNHSGQKQAKAAQGAGVPASSVAVIKGWADALRSGHPGRAAEYWAHPSAMVNGTSVGGSLAIIPIRTKRDALAADESLPCGATLQATSKRGRYVRATFKLGSRSGPGSGSAHCSGPASVDFLISGGHIVRWLRAPVGSRTSPAKPPDAAGAQPA